MATVADRFSFKEPRPDILSGTPRAHAIDRWIFVFMAAWFILVVLVGFIPDAIMKVQMVQAGQRPPFPLVMHMHAVAMGSFLLLLLAQTWLMATGRNEYHKRLGLAAFVLAPALVIAGVALAPTMYYETWNALQAAPPELRGNLQDLLSRKENTLLLQMRAGFLFPLLLAIGLWARGPDAGLHKRMMILAPAMALGAGIARITWLPTSMPASPAAMDFYVVLAFSPMLLWDVIRNRGIHRAYWIWLAFFVPASVFVDAAWNKPWWHATARQIMGV
jgi:hypothetical protein